jgi:hypothetical protein
MVRGNASNRTPDDPGQGAPGGPGARQREVLAQFEAAIAGMDTRQIQVGLRHLLGGARGAHLASGFHGAGVTSRGRSANAADGNREAYAADEDPGADGVGEEPGADEADGAGESRGADGAGESRGAGVAGGELADNEEPGAVSSGRPWVDLDEVPGPVAELLLSVRTPRARRQLERLISAAELDRTGPVDPATAGRMVRPYSWLLDRVGDDGIKLTDAGHLPPAEVAAVIDELNLAAEGITRVSRENQARPALQLRESAQVTGLVRRDRGRLVRTAEGTVLRRDPVALWWHLAEQLPLRSAAVSEVQPGLILLACVAAQYTGTLDDTIAAMLTAIGWTSGDGSPLTAAEAAAATSGTHAALQRLGALPASPDGVAFARAALSTWPGTA